MLLIKRYPNRKLYNTARKSYITLDELHQLIVQGEDIRVEEHPSGEDLTSLTLSQVILETQKERTLALPTQLLTRLVRFGGARFRSQGEYNLAFETELRLRLDQLVLQAAISNAEANDIFEILTSVTVEPEPVDHPGRISNFIERLLARQKIVQRADLDSLSEQIERLEKTIHNLPALADELLMTPADE